MDDYDDFVTRVSFWLPFGGARKLQMIRSFLLVFAFSDPQMVRTSDGPSSLPRWHSGLRAYVCTITCRLAGTCPAALAEGSLLLSGLVLADWPEGGRLTRLVAAHLKRRGVSQADQVLLIAAGSELANPASPESSYFNGSSELFSVSV